jgi:hypothetical protein
MGSGEQRERGALHERALHWLRSFRFREEFDSLDPATRSEILNDLGIAAGDVDAMAALAMNTDGLDRVLSLLRIDPHALETGQPDLMAALRRSCAKCQDWRECARALDAGEFSTELESYCMNKDEIRKMKNGL